jgi:hypothetical protein
VLGVLEALGLARERMARQFSRQVDRHFLSFD